MRYCKASRELRKTRSETRKKGQIRGERREEKEKVKGKGRVRFRLEKEDRESRARKSEIAPLSSIRVDLHSLYTRK